jgi:hypothetical protein
MARLDLTDRFPRVLRALHDQGWMGITQLRVWQQVSEYLRANPALFKYAPAYWTITSNALFDYALLGISRLLDDHGDAASIEYLLNLAQSGAESFKETKTKKNAVLTQVSEDQKRLEQLRHKAAPIIEKRNKVLAHLNRKPAADLNELAEMFPVDPIVVEEIFVALSEIVNTYNGLWDNSETLWELVGGDDFEGLGRLLRIGQRSEEEEWKKRLECLGDAESTRDGRAEPL